MSVFLIFIVWGNFFLLFKFVEFFFDLRDHILGKYIEISKHLYKVKL